MEKHRYFKANNFIAATFLGLVGCQSVSPPTAAIEINTETAPTPQSTSTFEGEAQIIEVGMGVTQVEFWKRLQLVAAHPEWISDFPKIAEILNLQLTDPIDAINPFLQAVQVRKDLRSKIGRSYFLDDKSFYGVLADYPQMDKLYKNLSLQFISLSICISANEIERVLGPGSKALVIRSHGANPPHAAKNNPIGYAHGIIYEDTKKATRTAFSISPSGCATGMSVRQDFN